MSAQITLNWTKDSTFETLLDGQGFNAGRLGRMQRNGRNLPFP